MRLFQLHRDTDVTGVSGTGIVADGIEWPDGTVSIRWRGDRPSVVFWESVADAIAVHGHVGATRFVWLGYNGQPLAEALRSTPFGDRGLGTWGEITDTYDAEVSVSDSSSAEQDAVWLRIQRGRANRQATASAHLNAKQAVAVRDALNNWLLWLGHAAAYNPRPTETKE